MKTLKFSLVAALGTASVMLAIGAGRNHRQPSSDPVARGKYLVEFGGCNDCHTPHKMGPRGPEPDMTRYLSGHPSDAKLPPPPAMPTGPWCAVTVGDTAWSGPWGITYSANLTPERNSGIGIWNEQMFLQAMKTGRHMGSGRPILPPMPWQSLANLTDEDLKAIFAFLQTIPPVPNHVSEPQGPAGTPHFE